MGLNIAGFWVNSPLLPSDWPRHQIDIIKGSHTTNTLERRKIMQLSSDEIPLKSNENLALNSTSISLPPKCRGHSVRRGRKNIRTRGGLLSCVLNMTWPFHSQNHSSCGFLRRPAYDWSYQHFIMAGELEAPTLFKDSLAINDGGGTSFSGGGTSFSGGATG